MSSKNLSKLAANQPIKELNNWLVSNWNHKRTTKNRKTENSSMTTLTKVSLRQKTLALISSRRCFTSKRSNKSLELRTSLSNKVQTWIFQSTCRHSSTRRSSSWNKPWRTTKRNSKKSRLKNVTMTRSSESWELTSAIWRRRRRGCWRMLKSRRQLSSKN